MRPSSSSFVLLVCLVPTIVVAMDPLCAALATCLAYGQLPCDRAVQICPPCIYIDSKNRFLCFDKVTGTSLCPFVNTTADCSNGTTLLPQLVDKIPFPPLTTPPPPASPWSSLATGLLITLCLVLALAVAGISLWYFNHARYHVTTPVHFLVKSPRNHNPSFLFQPSPPPHTLTCMETQSISSVRSLSFCHIMEPPRDSCARPSDAL
ncbi:Aste57867_12268 [Aphanomyces stellatus]|uniref:Aste57867_12268 protein n=1 Tax=Aphanomyces stellatus TaxID=120398 RepID=A0A485KVJ6_9STRA|nr:hypothetical protein As57867_012223 [Aphanomyces stellatus]VFT89121.1 Aste57867_12268 [Aphanomyces stellatus]